MTHNLRTLTLNQFARSRTSFPKFTTTRSHPHSAPLAGTREGATLDLRRVWSQGVHRVPIKPRPNSPTGSWHQYNVRLLQRTIRKSPAGCWSPNTGNTDGGRKRINGLEQSSVLMDDGEEVNRFLSPAPGKMRISPGATAAGGWRASMQAGRQTFRVKRSRTLGPQQQRRSGAGPAESEPRRASEANPPGSVPRPVVARKKAAVRRGGKQRAA